MIHTDGTPTVAHYGVGNCEAQPSGRFYVEVYRASGERIGSARGPFKRLCEAERLKHLLETYELKDGDYVAIARSGACA